jgi:hypothetical protein
LKLRRRSQIAVSRSGATIPQAGVRPDLRGCACTRERDNELP